MIEIVPNCVDTAFMYFHTRCSSGDELSPFVDEMWKQLPCTYIWAGDGCIEGLADDPIMGNAVSHGTGSRRYWFVFPMHESTSQAFEAGTEAMGAVLATAGGYVNQLVDQVMGRFHLPAARVVLCGHQHGACVALAAAMLRREDPFALAVLLDPWPLETLYLRQEHRLPATKVVCIDNLWVRERERRRGAGKALYEVFRQVGMNAEGVTLQQGQDKPDEYMFREAVRQIKAVLG